MLRQVEIPGKGQGLIATTQIPVGTILIEEFPLITINGDPNPYAVQEIVTKFQHLTEEQKNQVLSLHDPGPASFQGRSLPFTFAERTEEKVVRIFMTNSISLCGHTEMNVNKSGLYGTISRINHSCAPNVVWSWLKRDESRSVKQVRVCRKIREGEEILASYCGNADKFPSKNERQMKLKTTWNFSCNCEVCSLTGDKLMENEKARKRISDLHEAIASKALIGLVEPALKDAKEKLKIMKSIKDEMILDLPAALMECCELAAHCKLSRSNAAELMKKAKEMSELHGDCCVYNYNEEEKKIKRIQRFPSSVSYERQ